MFIPWHFLQCDRAGLEGRGRFHTKNRMSGWLEVSPPAGCTEMVGSEGVWGCRKHISIYCTPPKEAATQFWVIVVMKEYDYRVSKSCGLSTKIRKLNLDMKFHDS